MIHLHGGKLIVNSRGRVVTFQIVVPLNCNITKQPVPEDCVQNGDKAVCANGKGEVIDVKLPLESDKAPFVLLVMADKELSDYLNETFSASFRMTTLEKPEQVFSFQVYPFRMLLLLTKLLMVRMETNFALR